jgi:hypothetical protein
MPNWCWNNVTVTHPDKSKIEVLVAELQKKIPELFNLIRPVPETEKESYSWCRDNWGTKWDIEPEDWELHNDGSLSFSFNSAWSPPIALYDFMTEQGYQIDALYHEDGVGFIGKYHDGVDECYDTDGDIEEIPEDLIEYGDLRNLLNEENDEDEETVDDE